MFLKLSRLLISLATTLAFVSGCAPVGPKNVAFEMVVHKSWDVSAEGSHLVLAVPEGRMWLLEAAEGCVALSDRRTGRSLGALEWGKNELSAATWEAGYGTTAWAYNSQFGYFDFGHAILIMPGQVFTADSCNRLQETFQLKGFQFLILNTNKGISGEDIDWMLLHRIGYGDDSVWMPEPVR